MLTLNSVQPCSGAAVQLCSWRRPTFLSLCVPPHGSSMEYTIVCPIVVVLAIGAFLLHVLVLVCCVCSLSIQDFRMNCMFTVLCPFSCASRCREFGPGFAGNAKCKMHFAKSFQYCAADIICCCGENRIYLSVPAMTVLPICIPCLLALPRGVCILPLRYCSVRVRDGWSEGHDPPCTVAVEPRRSS